MGGFPIQAAHTYGAKRADGHRNCNPDCSPTLGVRVPDTAAGRLKHDAAHTTYGSVTGTPPTPAPGPAPSTPQFPFDLQASTTGKLVIGHWVTSMPRSLDDRTARSIAAPGDYWDLGYMDHGGENGAHDAYYALCFNRPQGRSTVGAGWRDADARFELLDALAHGVDVVELNTMVVPPSGNWQPEASRAMCRQAAVLASEGKPGSVMLSLDVTTSWSTSMTRDQQVAFLTELITTAGAGYRRLGGRVVISAFGAEAKTPAWFLDLFAAMKPTVGDVHLLPCFLNVSKAAPFMAAGLAPSYGEWGNASPALNPTSATGFRRQRITAAHTAGSGWVAPIHFTDTRPREGLFDEANNTQNLRDTWQLLIDGTDRSSDMARLVTLNDHAEGAAQGRSMFCGDTILNLDAYYAQWLHTGRPSVIVRDAVYLTHRRQPVAGSALTTYSLQMVSRAGSSPPRDTIEALVMLTSPADVDILVNGSRVGGQTGVPAGRPIPILAPLTVGQVSTRITRQGLPVLEVTSPYPVAARWPGRDLQYVASHKIAA